ncbi:3'5'-cyclic nucleotide phosphodiesterase family protein [Tritrichomonas foetus]|uniref:3'5'-cyclic nucleotide phosphodiesterase family protein n=1 Tax=Tritrichomonas foetus TaxID=1144522 RepID=A0A1J4J0G1_9EUKA|nr:3'5'-cyclic nucleotide phosphodiesterase family protein [Tritrichomonas foetus]|eukprot:OHS93072.1 3'5'-cyclic nucleotide phosphodiesterase family protein [Tritrichomonas foetus]
MLHPKSTINNGAINYHSSNSSSDKRSLYGTGTMSRLGPLQKPPHECFDDIISEFQKDPLNVAVETVLSKSMNAPFVCLWVDIPIRNCLYSPTNKVFTSNEEGIIGFIFQSATIVCSNPMSAHPNYSEKCDSQLIPANSSVLLFPLTARDKTVQAIVQLARTPPQPPFDQKDVSTAKILFKKFRLFSSYLFSPRSAMKTALDLVELSTFPAIVRTLTDSLQNHFRCRKAEIWLHNPNKTQFFRFEPDREVPIQLEPVKSGIAGYCLQKCCSVIERSVRHHESYNEVSDGYHDEPILAQPYFDSENRIWTVVLRGRANPRYFRASDASELRAIIPFVIKSMCASMSPPQFEAQLDDFEQRLTALLEVAEILSGVLDIDVLIPTIMERACSLLNAERCSLFLVDPGKQQLVSRFQGGLDRSIRIPIGRGIVGHTATTGAIINIPDAYLDDRFDKTVDIKTGYRTKSILCVPIFNNRGEIAGVTEMINKIDERPFNDDDVKMLMAFNVFCGISLDNAKLYNASLDLTRQLRTFVGLSAALGHTDTIRNVLYQILENVSQIVNATRATLFLYDTSDRSFTLLINVGERVTHDDVFAQETIAGRTVRMFVGDQINSVVHQTTRNQATQEYEEIMGIENIHDDQGNNPNAFRGRITNFIERDAKLEEADVSKATEDVICDIPLFSSDQTPLGIIELESNSKILTEDIKLLDCFAVFAAVSIERSQLMDLATLGQSEMELKQWISDEERALIGQIPTKLLINDPKIYTVDFDAQAWDGAGHIKVLFSIFSRFELAKEFKITNEKLFKFITEIRDTYNKVPYHNWRHAVDVTQFVIYQLIWSGYDKVFSKFELFALIVASICHDANHDGFSNVYNVKAETPLGILFKNQSVMETHHCQTSIGVISKEECNIFSIFNPQEYSQMWTTIIKLILATDMARHFDLLKKFNQLYDDNELSLEDPEHRTLLMQMILKCGDISNVARPFELADKWCDVLCEEFFRQGDLEMANGMEYTSPLNDRSHLDKPKSQIGFYTFVCLPLFQATAKAVPKLEVNVKQVESNLAIWKARTEGQAKAS